MKTRQNLNDDISNRQKYNICILKLVADMVKQYPVTKLTTTITNISLLPKVVWIFFEKKLVKNLYMSKLCCIFVIQK